MKFKKNIIVFSVAFLFMLSALPPLANAGTPEKVEVIIGFQGKPDISVIKGFNGNPKNEISGINAVVAMIPENALIGLRNHPDIKYVEFNRYIKWIQNDEVDWGVNRIDADIVWGGYDGAVDVNGNDGSGVIVAIVDTGIDYNHIELDANYIGGKDFVNGDDDPWDDNGHGTHCAGIVAAEDNGIGVIGVAPGASLMAVKVLDSGGSGSYANIAAGIIYAADHGAKVISLSLGGSQGSTTLEYAVDYAFNDKGCVVVAASGNSGHPTKIRDVVLYPARYSSVIAVGATTISDTRASFSSTGPSVELAAPGYQILSTYPGNYLAVMSGTSMACPHVSGVAALLIASGITSNIVVRNVMKDTAEDLGASGFDWEFGYGLVDAYAAVLGNGQINNPPVADFTYSVDGLTVTFTDTSTDDGSIVSWNWNFGDGYTSAQQNPSHTYSTYGTYAVTLTVTDDDEATDIISKNIELSSGNTGGDMWVSDISWRTKNAGKNVFLYYTVTVTSEDGPVSSATVYSTLTDGTTIWSYSGLTDSNGKVEFGRKIGTGDYIAEVIDITHIVYTYNPTLDVGNPTDPYTIG